MKGTAKIGTMKRCSVACTALVMAVLVVLSVPAARAADLSIAAEAGRISGYAHQVALGRVLEQLSALTGCRIFVDEKLYDQPVSFEMNESLPSEQAIKRMIHPYSNAMVYEAVQGSDQVRIVQIKVFDQGAQAAGYVQALGRSDYRGQTGDVSGQRVSSLLSGNAVSAGEQAVQKHVKPALSVEKNALGLPRFKFNDRGRGPDYRPDTLTMRKAFANYQKDKKAYQLRTEQAAMHDARAQALKAQAQYQQQRFLSLKHTMRVSN